MAFDIKRIITGYLNQFSSLFVLIALFVFYVPGTVFEIPEGNKAAALFVHGLLFAVTYLFLKKYILKF